MKKIIIAFMAVIICFNAAGCRIKAEGETKTSAVERKVEEANVISLETLKEIPQFKCKDVMGNEVSSEIFKDKKLTLINLWGTWCGPCVAELPALGELYNEGKDKGINVVGVVEDGMKNEEAVKKILDESGASFTNIIPDEKFYDDFVSLCGTYPSSILVDSEGKVIYEIISGTRTKEEYMKIIDEAMEKSK